MDLHELRALMAVVELVGRSIGVPALSEDQDVGGSYEELEGKGIDEEE
jgi:hypothetical protein